MEKLSRFLLKLSIVGFSLFVFTMATSAQQDVDILVQSSAIRGAANGIIFSADDQLYIASVTSSTITVIDPETGEILKQYGVEDGVIGPDDLVFGPDGSLFWTGIMNGQVGRITPDGESTIIAQLPPGSNPITFSDDGRLFVSLCFLGEALYEVDPNGEEGPRLIADELGGCGLNGMDWGPDGFLYGPRWFFGTVARVDVDNSEFTVVADEFGTPAAVKFDSQGRLHVLDTLSGEIVRVNMETGEKEVVTTEVFGGDNLAFDSEDRLYVSNFGNGSIVEILSDGSTRTVVPGGLAFPGGLEVVGDSLFVGNILSFAEIDRQTGEMLSTEIDIIGFGELGTVFTVGSAGENLVLTGWFSNSVRVWNPETREVIVGYDDFNVPINAIGFQGEIVVAELGTGSVVQTQNDERITLVSDMVVPSGLLASNDSLWVGDWATGTIWQIVADGELLTEPVAIVTDLAFPEGLALNTDGNMLVVETGTQSLLSVNLESGEISTVAIDLDLGVPAPLEDAVPTWSFNDVTVSSDGKIYVSGDIANVIYTIER